MRLHALLLILGLSLLTACGSARRGGSSGDDDDDSANDDDAADDDDLFDPDDDDASPDDDDDETPVDDDDATLPDDDDTPTDDDDATFPDDDDTSVDDDDTTSPDDDDTSADDDDTGPDPTVSGSLLFNYYSDADAQNLLCQQVYNFSAEANWGSNPAGGDCFNCTGYLFDVDVTPSSQTTCSSSQLGTADFGDVMTDPTENGDFGEHMAVIDVDTALAMGLSMNDSGTPSLQEVYDDNMAAGNEITHLMMIDQAPGNFWTDVVDLDAGGGATVPGTDWIIFWTVVSQGGSPTEQMSGDYAAVAQWALNGLGLGPSGPEVARFAMAISASP